MDKVYIISGLLSFLSFPLIAQNSDYQAQYREKVLEYNQDLKAAGYNEAMKQEMIKSARADFKPKLSAEGNFNYTGNPLELSIDLPSMNSPLYFQGKDLKYGATLSLSQPIYTGGGIRANYQKALFVLEHGKSNNFESHPHFVERRVYGSVNFSFFKLKVES